MYFFSVESDELETNNKDSQGNSLRIENHEDQIKMKERVMCKQVSLEDDSGDKIKSENAANGNDYCDVYKNGSQSPSTEVPIINSQSKHVIEFLNSQPVSRLNGLAKKEPLLNGTNGSLQHLLLLDNAKKNGDISPSLKEPKTPVILVKTVNDLNNICDSKSKNSDRKFFDRKEESEEERIQEYLKRGDTAVIYQEPVDQKAKGKCLSFFSLFLEKVLK